MLAPSTLDVATVDTLPEIADPAAPVTEPTAPAEVQPRWTLATRIAFRLCFLYFSLYVVSTQMLGGLLPFSWVRQPRRHGADAARHHLDRHPRLSCRLCLFVPDDRQRRQDR